MFKDGDGELKLGGERDCAYAESLHVRTLGHPFCQIQSEQSRLGPGVLGSGASDDPADVGESAVYPPTGPVQVDDGARNKSGV